MKRACLSTLLLLLVPAAGGISRASKNGAAESPAIIFRATPAKHAFKKGEDIVLILSIRNNSSGPVFVSRLTGYEFVDIKLSGPDGKEVLWQGKGRIDSKSYRASDFTVLKKGERVRASRTISLKDGRGFVLETPGRYTATAEYSLGPPEYFATLAGKTKIPAGSFSSPPATLCLETCGPDSDK